MNKIVFPFIISLIISISSMVSGFTINENIELNHEIANELQNNVKNLGKAETTHTVFVEYATATWCPYCIYAHGALKELYEDGTVQFYYTSLVTDENKNANKRASDYNVYYIPDVFVDGGYGVECGAASIYQAKLAYTGQIKKAAGRNVADIGIQLDVTWLGNSNMHISANLRNNEENTYTGFLKIYIAEIVSSMGWIDDGGDVYTFPFLDYVINKEVTINGADTWHDETFWNGSMHNDGYGHNFGNIQNDNIIVFATIFNSTWHQGYAYPDENDYPFDAYYVDAAYASTITKFNTQPNEPVIDGNSSGKMGVQYYYTIKSNDADNDKIYCYIDWGDNTNSGWVGPVFSNEEVIVSHAWTEQGDYQIKGKVKDTFGVESNWTYLELKIPKNMKDLGLLYKLTGRYSIIEKILFNLLK